MSRERLRAGLGLLLGAAALLALANPAFAQVQGTIAVTVIDATNDQPINGARVVLVGTNLTGVTDGRGQLTLTNVPADAYTVRVLSIGYGSQEQNVTVSAGGTATVAFEMSLSGFTLDEIVVTGTGGAVERRKLGSSLSSVNVAKVEETVPVQDFGTILQARIPAVRSVSMGGGIGTAKDLKVRGMSSFSLGQRPVIYVDGVRVDNQAGHWGDGNIACCWFAGGAGNDRLGDLNPEDIERVEVIKGAAAATLYGTEATNGVIQIFTKRGRANSAPRWTMSYVSGFNRLRENMPTKLYPNFSGPEGFQAHDSNELIENGLIQQANVGVQGGGENVQYFVDGGLLYEEGSIQPNDMTRGNLRLNLNWRPSEKWSFEVNSAYSNNRTQLVQAGNNWSALLGNAILGNPQNATEERPFGEPWVAVADIKEIQSISYVNRWTGGLTANYSPTSAFTHRITLGLDMVSDRRERLHPFGNQYIYVGNDGERSIAFRNFQSWTVDYLGSLSFNLGSQIQSDLSFGAQGFWEGDRNNNSIGRGFAGAGVTVVSGAAERLGNEGFREEINLGIFAQNRFSLFDRIFTTVGARLDGNSSFGTNFGFQFYPKGEIAYLISEESFWQSVMPGFINTFKLRSAVGMSGLAPGAFDQFRTFEPLAVFDNTSGVEPDNPGNADLEPEKTMEIEGGVDLSLFNDRVTLEATYYYAKTTDALLPVPLPPSRGFPSSRLENVGEVENKGWETKLDMTVLESGSFRWSAGFNMDYNRNKILYLGDQAECNEIGQRNQYEEGAECQLGSHRLGKSVRSRWNRVADTTEYAGGWNYDDSTHVRTDTTVFIGDPLPHWNGSVSQTFEFGPFRLYGMATAEVGAWFSNGDRAYQYRQGGGDEYLALLNADGSSTNQSDSLQNYMRIFGSYDQRDHIRLTEVSLSYELPDAFCSMLGLGRSTLTLSGQNLMWWDDCNCRDPQGSYYGGAYATAHGGDFLSQPSPRRFTIAFRTTF